MTTAEQTPLEPFPDRFPTFDHFREYLRLAEDSDRLESARLTYEVQVLQDQQMPATVPLCPAWCAQPLGHTYDCVLTPDTEVLAGADVTWLRVHTATAEGTSQYGTVAQEERNTDGVVVFSSPSVEVFELPFTKHLTPEQARELGASFSAELLALAGRLETILAGRL